MKPYTIVATTKRLLKVTAEDEQEAITKAYQALMQFKQTDVEPVAGLTMTIELQGQQP